MDCGPASLKALLEGFHVSVSYGRLREACQTDVDGTSIDTLEDIARQLGLAVEQVIVPVDHVFSGRSSYLPALIVIRHPDGQTHFVVVWSLVGPWVQVMDPGLGRRWIHVDRFRADLYLHGMQLPLEAVRPYMRSRRFLGTLRDRMAAIGLGSEEIERLIARVDADPGRLGHAVLDAATRMFEALARADGVHRGKEAAGLVSALVERVLADPASALTLIPRVMWFASPGPGEQESRDLVVRGAVLVRVRGVQRELPKGPDPLDEPESPDPLGEDEPELEQEEVEEAPQPLPPALAAALSERPARPLEDLVETLRADGLLSPAVLLATAVVAALGVMVEALLLRGLLELGASLELGLQRAAGLGVLGLFALALLGVEWGLASLALRMGRLLELRLRVAFQEKIPRLGDRYLQSRPTSDMAERGHSAHIVRALPSLGLGLLRATLGLIFTAAGIAWLDPRLTPLALLAAGASVALPLAIQPILTERDLRFRTHLGSLSRFYLDALLGLTAVRTHGAEAAVRRQHESLLTAWTRAGLDAQRVAVGVEGAQALVGFSIAGALILAWLLLHPSGGGVLLLAWWALNMPALGQSVAQASRQYPGLRNVTLRLLEPLGAPDETDGISAVAAAAEDHAEGVALRFEGVGVLAAGHRILSDLDLRLEPGEHVAVVGASGAGKSSLLGLLLGWHRASEGRVLADGEVLEGERLARLRRETAWVDPGVQLWNQPFLENLLYGADPKEAAALSEAMETADLRDVLERLPDGLATRLGEGGALLSGGQGQRVRLGRAALRGDARLVLLDEPFRGLDRDRRHALLARARRRWPRATLLCVTHDVGDTFDFARVLVIEGGRVVEDAPPALLAADPESRYRALLDAEGEVRRGLWGSARWRRFSLGGGRVHEQSPTESP